MGIMVYMNVYGSSRVTLWCTNFFFYPEDTTPPNQKNWHAVVARALDQLKSEFDHFIAHDATYIFVTNEIGSGGVSESVVQRHFTDLQGWMNQYIASKANEVYLMISGIPVKIK